MKKGEHYFFTGFSTATKLLISHTLLKSALFHELGVFCNERGEIIAASKEQLCNVGGRKPKGEIPRVEIPTFLSGLASSLLSG